MPKYEVCIQMEYEVTVYADDEDEAREVAYEELESGDLVWDTVLFTTKLED